MRYSGISTLLLIGLTNPALAGTISVPADFATIQGAINAAANGDVIVVAPGGYAQQLDFLGKAITLTSENPLDPAATTLTAAAGSVVTFDNGEGPLSKLVGFTINNVNAVAGGGAYVGPSANPVIEKCVFAGNLANTGGGMAVYGGAVVRSCVFVGNIAVNTGGGLFAGVNSNLVMDACQFEGNDAPIGSGMRVQNDATVTNTEVFDNVAGSAVAIAGNGPVDLVNCTVFGNAQTGIELAAGAGFMTTVANSIVRGNAGQIVGPAAFLDVRYSNVQGGFAGPGNINAAPGFVNAAFGDFRLQATSVCIDAGENASVPSGILFDRGGIVRFVDKLDIVDTGVGTPPIVDMGANEFPPPRRYVNVDAVGDNTGMTWAHAYTDLQDAIDEAMSGADIEEILVAAGTYHPDRGTGDRTRSFQMVSDVEIIGGFAGTELDASENDPATNQTILGGAIGGPGDADNSYHVVKAINVNDNGRLIGFIVQKGHADGGGVDDDGGGIYINGGNPVIRECWVRQNYAADEGGGLYSVASDPNIVRTRFNINESGTYAGGLYFLTGEPQILNCYIAGNLSDGAAAIYGATAVNPEIANCTIVGNTSITGICGGVVLLGGGTMTNNILWNNFATDPSTEVQQLYFAGPNPTIDYSCVKGWTGALGGTFNFGTNPSFIDAAGPDNAYGTSDDNPRLSLNSACLDSADSAALPAFVVVDIDGLNRFFDDTGVPNLGAGPSLVLDRGAYEANGTSCQGDMDGNGTVNIDDLLAVINDWGPCSPCFSDLTGNGTVNIDDLLTVINHWGVCPP